MRSSFPLKLTFSENLTSEQAIERVQCALKSQDLVMTFPVKPGNKIPSFPIDLGELLDVTTQENDTGKQLIVAIKGEVFDQVAYRWNMSLSQMPANAIPRSQRLALSILGKKLTAEPTGQRMHDYARRRILDTTQNGIGPTIAGEALRRAEAALAA